MAAPEWHWVGFGEISKNIEVRFGAMTDGGDWGTVYLLDQTPPNEVANFEGQFLTLTELMALRTLAKTPLGATGVTTVLGQTWTGIIVSVKPVYVKGSEFFGCQLGLLNCTVTGP